MNSKLIRIGLAALLAGIVVPAGSAFAVSTFSVDVDCRGPQGVDADSSTQVPTKLCHSGTLEAVATGFVVGNTPTIGVFASAESLGGNGTARGIARAGFTDQIGVVNNRLPFNTTVFFDMQVLFDGLVSAQRGLGTVSDPTSGPAGRSQALVTGSLSFGLSGVVNDRIELSYAGDASPGGESIDRLISYNNLAVRVGQTYNLGMNAFASAFVRYEDSGALGPARAVSDFGNTLAWAGISAIRDADGNPLDLADFSFVGSSGYDYRFSSVSPVPVPAAAWLFACGCLGLLGLSRRPANDRCNA